MSPADGHLIELVHELNRENERLHAELDTLRLAHSGCNTLLWDTRAVPYYAFNRTGTWQTFTLGHVATDGNA